MNISTCHQLLAFMSIFSTKVITSDLPTQGAIIRSQTNRCVQFTQAIINQKSAVGVCTSEQNQDALKRIRRAECMFCLGVSCCAAGAYGAFSISNPVEAYLFSTLSGFGSSLACTMATNNNPHCGLYQADSSLHAKTEEEKIVRIVALELRKQFAQQQSMTIAPSPIESNQNPLQ